MSCYEQLCALQLVLWEGMLRMLRVLWAHQEQHAEEHDAKEVARPCDNQQGWRRLNRTIGKGTGTAMSSVVALSHRQSHLHCDMDCYKACTGRACMRHGTTYPVAICRCARTACR